MSKKINVNPDHYKTAGRERPGDGVAHTANRSQLRENQRRLSRETKQQNFIPQSGAGQRPLFGEPPQVAEKAAEERKKTAQELGTAMPPSKGTEKKATKKASSKKPAGARPAAASKKKSPPRQATKKKSPSRQATKKAKQASRKPARPARKK